MDEAILAVGAPARPCTTLRERAAIALANARQDEEDRQREHEQWQDQSRRSDLAHQLKYRLHVEISPAQIERDPERNGSEAYTVAWEGLRFRYRTSSYAGDQLEVALTCPKCGDPVWVEIVGLADLGAKLETGAGHQVCPEEARRQEELEEEIAKLPPPAPRKPTTAEQLEQVVRAIAEDAAYQICREGL
jgi:hypothetical protein